MLVHVAIETESGAASVVAQRLAFVQGLTLHEVEGEDRLSGMLKARNRCPIGDVIRFLTADPAVVGVLHLATEENG